MSDRDAILYFQSTCRVYIAFFSDLSAFSVIIVRKHSNSVDRHTLLYLLDDSIDGHYKIIRSCMKNHIWTRKDCYYQLVDRQVIFVE